MKDNATLTPDLQGSSLLQELEKWASLYERLGFSVKVLGDQKPLGLAAVCGTPSGGLVGLRTDDSNVLRVLERLVPRTARVLGIESGVFCFVVEESDEKLASKPGSKDFPLEILGEGSFLLVPPIADGSFRWDLPSGKKVPQREDFTRVTQPEFERLLGNAQRAFRALRVHRLLIKHWNAQDEIDLVEALAGLCAWSWVPREVFGCVLDLFLEDTKNPKKDALLRRAARTYEKVRAGIKVPGWMQLRDLGWEVEEIKDLLLFFGVPPDVSFFMVHEGTVYWVDGKSYLDVGPAVSIQAIVESDQMYTYRMAYRGRSRILEEPKDLRSIRELTGRQILKESLFVKWLDFAARAAEDLGWIVKRRTRTGWEGDVFLHPLLQPEDIWDDHPLVRKKRAKRQNPEKQHELVLTALREGMALGGVTVIGASAAFLKKFNGVPFCLFISGPSGVGKTTLGLWASSLFYTSEEPLFTGNTTQVGFELATKEFEDLPVLLDEVVLKEADLEKIIFMTSSGKGRGRGTKQLTLQVSDLSTVVILTSEISETEYLRRVGTQRRILLLEISDWTGDVSRAIARASALKVILICGGAGVDWLKWAMENRSVLSAEAAALAESIPDTDPLARIRMAVFGTLSVLEKYYGEEFPSTRAWLEELLRQQTERFEKRADVVERFMDDFAQFLAMNVGKVMVLDPPADDVPLKEISPRELIAWKDHNGLYILTKAFEEFCREYGFHKNDLLRKLAEAEILKKDYSSRGFRTPKRIPRLGVSASTYHLILPEDFWEEVPL